MFAALSDPTRRAIVDRLSRGPASVSELARPLAMSLPAVVQHVQVLQTSGLVTTTKVGRVRTCRLDPDNLGEVELWLHERRIFWQHHLERLGRFLEDDERTRHVEKEHDDA
jgi:DNA-binding transcriptional ArsR family regulator